MIADSRRPDALVAAARRTPAPAIDRVADPADGQSDPNPPKPVARRRNKRRGVPCAVCGYEISPPSTGYAFVSIGAAQLRKQRHREWVAHGVKYGRVTSPPPPLIPWHAVHGDCHHAPAGSVYVLPLSKLRTHREVIEAMLKLSYEKWINHTSWQAMIRTLLDARR